jgi:hypothetical protein
VGYDHTLRREKVWLPLPHYSHTIEQSLPLHANRKKASITAEQEQRLISKAVDTVEFSLQVLVAVTIFVGNLNIGSFSRADEDTPVSSNHRRQVMSYERTFVKLECDRVIDSDYIFRMYERII